MKIHHFGKALGISLLLAMVSPSWAATGGDIIVTENNEAHAAELKNRMEEIRSLDKSTLSVAEKRALRREVREIKKELAALSGGVYLSVGAILLVALLLILLL